ncbi:MAG: hypothetical protein COY39_05720 [Alphaproteobacteria bacterium CG_4_10_14_0_8_um_filter_37_21]|nr:MAG: hypothetical protein COY39_05720 [Alphaproteobacteria bacterium CG_4_10_14_0_8_um_filter_37_21]
MLYFLILIFSLSALHAMVPGHNFTDDDFIQYAKKIPEAKSCCLIYSQDSQSQFSGVLIAPNVIATAAHGLVSILANNPPQLVRNGFVSVPLHNTYAQFDEGKSYRVHSAYIDQRYLDGDHALASRYDIAFITLERPILDRASIPLLPELDMPQDVTFTVVSHGISDLQSFWDVLKFWKPPITFLKRAYDLLEWTPVSSPRILGEDIQLIRTLAYSSIFFDARKTYRPYTVYDKSTFQRTMNAVYKWQKNGRPPFALALPGTSGAPVFARIHNTLYLAGVIVAYAPIKGNFLAPHGTSELKRILHNPKAAIGEYHTIFALFYKENTTTKSALKDGTTFVIDPNVKKILGMP